MSSLIIKISVLLGYCFIIQPEPEGYRDIIEHQDGFIATGSGGRIDWISTSGNIVRHEHFPGEKFNCLVQYDQSIIAAGDRGTIMISTEVGTFQTIASGTYQDINALVVFRGIVLAGSDDGQIVLSNQDGSFRIIKLPLKGNIVSLSARSYACYGVTDKGEIIESKDGITWDITDFNEKYSGYYEPLNFTKVLATDNRIAVTGVRDDGSPVVMFSNLGGVWTERHLYYKNDQGSTEFLMDPPNDIYFDGLGNQFILVCDNGKLLGLPSCTQCNELTVISTENLKAIAGSDRTILVGGENFFLKTINLR